MTPNPTELKTLLHLAQHTRHAALDVQRLHESRGHKHRAGTAQVIAEICERVEESTESDLKYFWDSIRAQLPAEVEE